MNICTVNLDLKKGPLKITNYYLWGKSKSVSSVPLSKEAVNRTVLHLSLDL